MTEVKAQSSRMEFLFQASHTIFSSCPELSRFYMSEFQQCLRQQDLIPAKSITRSCCPRCGQIYVPGLNTSVRLESKKKKKNSSSKKNKNNDSTSKRKNQLIYQCNACTHKMKFQGSNLNIPKADLLETNKMTATTVAINTPNTITTATKNTKETIGISKLPSSSSSSKQPVQKQQQQQQQQKSLHQQQQPAGVDKKKKKNKGGKKNHLQAMLASRQQSKEAEKKGGGGLGLDDFLSSL